MPYTEEQRRESVSDTRLFRDDPKEAGPKIAIFQYLTVLIFLFLISGFWQLQVQNPEYYSEAAERNRIKSTPMLAPRGKILDRDGRAIVDNKSSYSLLLNRDVIKWEHLPAIAEALGLDYSDLSTAIRRMKSQPQIIIKDQLSRDEIAWIESHRDPSAYPEMQLIRSWRRQYPQDGFAAHAVGYVGEVSESDLNTPQFSSYQQGDIIGKDGLEKQYDKELRGVDGQQRVLVDNFGRERDVLMSQEAQPGKDLKTTLDLDLQAVAELSMIDKHGAVVALDPRTGEVLAMVSAPAYDPNKFTGRISRKDWNAITTDPLKPLMNRATQAEFAPGSTFKPIVALAGLGAGVITDKSVFHCSGSASFYGTSRGCWRHHGHGDISLHRGIVESCDVFFYNVGNQLGIDRLAEYAELAGFGRKTGIDLPNERESTMPSTKWKLRTTRQKWFAGETISVAIGQGAVTVSPLQLAAAIGGLGVGGNWYQPHLKKGDAPKLLRAGHLNTQDVQDVISGMSGVVNEDTGTGRFARLPGINICGKTGTAQLISLQAQKGGFAKNLHDNGWFVGFGPQEAPEIIVVALFENAEHGDKASWIVRDVLKAYFDKKARRSHPASNASSDARLQLPELLRAPLTLLTFRSGGQ